MANSSMFKALIAAFSFGNAFNAASVALFLYTKGQGSAFLRDGPRLVLVTFFATAALWAQTDFISTLISTKSAIGCQVAISFASAFDQLARVCLIQGLFWEASRGLNLKPIGALLPQAVIFLRFILGGVFVGTQRTQLDTICLVRSPVLPLGITVLAVDAIITTGLLARAIVSHNATKSEGDQNSSSRKRAVIFAVAGLGIWTAMSAPMILGVSDIDLIARTAVPATGLGVVIGILMLFKESIVKPKQPTNQPNVSTSSDLGVARDLASRDISTANSSYPPSRYEEVKMGATASFAARNDPRLAPRELEGGLPLISRPNAGQATIGMGGVPVQGQLFPPIRAATEPGPSTARDGGKQTPRGLRKKGDRIMISNPILNQSDENNPLKKIATIDLGTAARMEKERRDMNAIPDLLQPRAAPQPPALSPEELMKRSQSFKRKDVGDLNQPKEPFLLPAADTAAMATTTSMQLSPGVEEIRRRSPGQAPRNFSQKTPPVTPVSTSRAPSSKSSTPPKRPARPATLELPGLSPTEPAPRDAISRPPTRPGPPERSELVTASPPKPLRLNNEIPRDAVPPPPPEPLQRRPTLESVTSSTTDPSVALRMSILPRNNSVRMNIRPSRQRPASPSAEEPPKTAKTPVQMRAQSGLPGNPRAQAMKILSQEQVFGQEQTVMFMKDIEYDDPDTVRNIMEATKYAKSPAAGITRVTSVVHRPRPIPRKPDVDRAIFPAEGSPNMHNHKRSLSSESARRKRSILNSTPSGIPVLPPMPKSAGSNSRPQPNNTTSMTWDEKMQMFYPSPPSASLTPRQTRRRSSSLPEVPKVPAVYLSNAAKPKAMMGGNAAEQRADRSTGSSVETNIMLDVVESPARASNYPNASKFSITTYQSASDETKSRAARSTVQSQVSNEGVRRRSSPVLPDDNLSPMSSSESTSHDYETATNWGSVHSPVKAVNLQRAQPVEVPTMTKLQPSKNDEMVVNARAVSVMSQEDDRETMTVMLDPSLSQDVRSAQGSRQGRGFETETEEATQMEGQWHRRVGDVCPTFSDRTLAGKLRKTPPPAPLMLNRTNKVPLVVQAEPSPLESPQHALDIIEEQLKHLEGSGRSSMNMEQQRMTLLANLEMEMGQQENRWYRMRDTLVSRDSLSTTIDTSPNPASRHASARSSVGVHSGEKALRSFLAERRASRRQQSRAFDDAMSASSRESGSTHSINWQLKLAEAQLEYLGHRPEMPAARISSGMNFLAVSTVSQMQLGSPTPPDTDDSGSEYEDDSRTIVDLEAPAKSNIGVAGLWTQADKFDSPLAKAGRRTFLWTAPAKPPTTQVNYVEPINVDSPEELNQRGWKTRKPLSPLTIESSSLWEKPLPTRRFSAGLWRAAVAPRPHAASEADPSKAEEAVPVTRNRPVTQRPPRRNKRVTLLPDILESPKPLPDKRGTLGIFQFAWGDVSDTATVQPGARMYKSIPGTMSSGGGGRAISNPEPDVQTQRIESSELDEYSQSFFDDYEEEDEGDNFDDWEMYGGDAYGEDDDETDIEEDDGFDETTLWEIASLLKSDDVPSRDSLLPQDNGRQQGSSSQAQGQGLLSLEDKRQSDKGQGDHRRHPHQEGEENLGGLGLGNLSGGHGDKSDTANAAPGLPADDELTSDAASEGQAQLEMGWPQSFPSPPKLSAHLWTSQGVGERGRVTPTQTQTQTRHGQKQRDDDGEAQSQSLQQQALAMPQQAPGTLPQPDAQLWSRYLALVASATDSLEGRGRGLQRNAERQVVEAARDDGVEGWRTRTRTRDSDAAEFKQTLWAISAPMPEAAPLGPSATEPTGLWGNIGMAASSISQHRRVEPPPTVKGLWLPHDDQASRTCYYLPSSSHSHGNSHIQTRNSCLDPPLPHNSASALPSSLRSSQPSINDDNQDSHLWNPALAPHTLSNSMALWSPTAPVHASPKGLPQPDAAVWGSYLPSANDSVRVVPRKAEAATIESASLWSPTQKLLIEAAEEDTPVALWGAQLKSSPTTLPGMWEKPAPIQQVSYGLSQPAHVWGDYLPAKEDILRVKPREATPAAIESSELWSPPPRTTMSETTEFLWTASKNITITTESETSSSDTSSLLREAVNYGLWAAPAAADHDEAPLGLFSLSHRRSDYRSSQMPPAALDTVRKTRALDAFDDFVFSYLWNENPLWRGPPKVVHEKAEGLFSLDHRRTVFRTTPEPPAALSMLRNPRLSDEPLPKLTSDSLWSVPPPKAASPDWLSLSTTSSVPSSVSDAESVAETEASSVDDSDVESLKSELANVERVLRRVEATASEWKDALTEAIAASTQTSKSALWAKTHHHSKDAVVSPAAPINMWQPASAEPAPISLESEYTIDEADEERSSTFRYRRKSDDDMTPAILSPSNFSLLSSPETPRDFSAQALWSSTSETFPAEEKTWLDESVVRVTPVSST